MLTRLFGPQHRSLAYITFRNLICELLVNVIMNSLAKHAKGFCITRVLVGARARFKTFDSISCHKLPLSESWLCGPQVKSAFGANPPYFDAFVIKLTKSYQAVVCSQRPLKWPELYPTCLRVICQESQVKSITKPRVRENRYRRQCISSNTTSVRNFCAILNFQQIVTCPTSTGHGVRMGCNVNINVSPQNILVLTTTNSLSIQ